MAWQVDKAQQEQYDWLAGKAGWESWQAMGQVTIL
jgi:hypothetical protein